MNFITRLNFLDMSVNIDQVLEETKVRSAKPNGFKCSGNLTKLY
jgi:hypothetical protein